ncbi:MAG: hypothetical protein ACRDFX_00110 [Chloroflexota bacterium]
MADNRNDDKKVSVSVPIGAVVLGVTAALAGAAYTLLKRDADDAALDLGQKMKPVRGMRKKIGLVALAGLIENDKSRKLLVATLRAMARRA